jgi:hypothetical protein
LSPNIMYICQLYNDDFVSQYIKQWLFLLFVGLVDKRKLRGMLSCVGCSYASFDSEDLYKNCVGFRSYGKFST